MKLLVFSFFTIFFINQCVSSSSGGDGQDLNNSPAIDQEIETAYPQHIAVYSSKDTFIGLLSLVREIPITYDTEEDRVKYLYGIVNDFSYLFYLHETGEFSTLTSLTQVISGKKATYPSFLVHIKGIDSYLLAKNYYSNEYTDIIPFYARYIPLQFIDRKNSLYPNEGSLKIFAPFVYSSSKKVINCLDISGAIPDTTIPSSGITTPLTAVGSIIVTFTDSIENLFSSLMSGQTSDSGTPIATGKLIFEDNECLQDAFGVATLPNYSGGTLIFIDLKTNESIPLGTIQSFAQE